MNQPKFLLPTKGLSKKDYLWPIFFLGCICVRSNNWYLTLLASKSWISNLNYKLFSGYNAPYSRWVSMWITELWRRRPSWRLTCWAVGVTGLWWTLSQIVTVTWRRRFRSRHTSVPRASVSWTMTVTTILWTMANPLQLQQQLYQRQYQLPQPPQPQQLQLQQQQLQPLLPPQPQPQQLPQQ